MSMPKRNIHQFKRGDLFDDTTTEEMGKEAESAITAIC